MSSQLTLALVIATSVMVAMSSVPVNAGPKMTDLILDACERKGGPNSEDYQKVRFVSVKTPRLYRDSESRCFDTES